MNRRKQEYGNILESLEEASAINKTILLMLSMKAGGNDMLIGDDECFGFMLILEQLGDKLEKAARCLKLKDD